MNIPCPSQLRLEEDGQRGICEPGQEDKVDNVSEVGVYLSGKVENEARGVWNIPAED